MTLGEQIKEAREKKNYSQEELAELCEVSRQAVSKWENDISVPQGVNRETLAEALGMECLREENFSSMGVENQAKDFAGMKRRYFALGASVAALLVCTISILLFVLTRPEGQDPDLTPGGTYQKGQDPDLAPGGTYQGGQDAGQLPGADAAGTGDREDRAQPEVTRISFYNGEEEEVLNEAGWYNAAYMESILIQWEGEVPASISIHYVPSGSETLEMSEILSTKPILDYGTAALLNPQALRDKGVHGHVTFQLNYGAYTINSEEYNIFYDPELPPAEE